MAGKLKHFDVVVVVTDGHDLIAMEAAMVGPAGESVAFGASGIEDVDHGKIALGIFGAQDCDAVIEARGFEGAESLGHARHGAAEHGLHGIGREGVFDRDDEVDVSHVLFEPAADAGVKRVEVFEDDGSFGFFIKGKNGVAAEFLHRGADIVAGLAGHEVAVESFAGKRAGDGAIGADEPEIEAELLGDGQGEGVAASGDEHDLDAGGVGAAQRGEIVGRNLELRIEKGAVDIGGEKANGAKSGTWRASWRKADGFSHTDIVTQAA